MTTSLVFCGILGSASTAAAFAVNRRLFTGAQAGSVSPAGGVLLRRRRVFVAPRFSNTRDAHLCAHRASYSNDTKMLVFTSPAFSLAFFLAFMEPRLRYNRSLTLSSTA